MSDKLQFVAVLIAAVVKRKHHDKLKFAGRHDFALQSTRAR
jgi:hypothetical protein